MINGVIDAIFNIGGLILLLLLGVSLYESYRNRKSADDIIRDQLSARKKRQEMLEEIARLKGLELDKRKAYEAKKEKVYDILNKRNNADANPNSSDDSGREDN